MDKESTANTEDTGKHEVDPWVGKIPWKRVWQTPPVFLPGKSHGQRNLMGYIQMQKSDTTEAAEHAHTYFIFSALFFNSSGKLQSNMT